MRIISHLSHFLFSTFSSGPTFLSGAIAAQAEIIPPVPSCPLVRGPARHLILNVLWASVNLLCVCLAASHLRKLKRDLGGILGEHISYFDKCIKNMCAN